MFYEKVPIDANLISGSVDEVLIVPFNTLPVCKTYNVQSVCVCVCELASAAVK